MLRRIHKTVVKKPLNALGYDLVPLWKLAQFSKSQTFEERLSWLRKLDLETVIDIGANTGDRLCNRGLLLDRGQVVCYDSVDSCVARYEQMMVNSDAKTSAAHVIYEANGKGRGQYEITKIEILDRAGTPKAGTYTWDSLTIRVHYSAQRHVSRGSVVILINSPDGVPLMVLSTQPDSAVPMALEVGTHAVDCFIEKIPLSAGDFLIGAPLALPNQEWLEKRELGSNDDLPTGCSTDVD